MIFILIWLVGAEKATTPTTPRKNESPMTPRKSEDGEKKAVSSNSGSSTPTKEDLSLKGKLPATAASGAPFLRRPTPTHPILTPTASSLSLFCGPGWWCLVASPRGVPPSPSAASHSPWSPRAGTLDISRYRESADILLLRFAFVLLRSFPTFFPSFFFVLRCIQSWLA